MCLVGLSTKATLLPKAIHAINQARRAGLYYTLNDKLYFCASMLKLLNERYYLIDIYAFPLPYSPFYGQYFEHLVAQFEVCHNFTVVYSGD